MKQSPKAGDVLEVVISLPPTSAVGYLSSIQVVLCIRLTRQRFGTYLFFPEACYLFPRAPVVKGTLHSVP